MVSKLVKNLWSKYAYKGHLLLTLPRIKEKEEVPIIRVCRLEILLEILRYRGTKKGLNLLNLKIRPKMDFLAQKPNSIISHVDMNYLKEKNGTA